MYRRMVASRLLRGVAVIATGNGLSSMLGFAVLVLLSRNLTPAALGIFAPIMSLLDITQIALDTAIGAGTVRVAARYLPGQQDRADMTYRWALLMQVGAVAAAALVGWLTAPWLSVLLFDSASHAGTLRVALVGLLGVAVYATLVSVLQAEQRFVRLSVVTQFKNAARLAMVSALVASRRLTTISAVWAYTLAALGSGALALLTTPTSFLARRELDAGIAREMMTVNKWMLVVMLAHVGGRIDIFMLSAMSRPDEVGWYSVAYQLCIGVALVNQSLITALLPRVSGLTDPSQMRAHFHACIKLVPLGVVLLLAVVLAGNWLIPLLLGESYTQVVRLFQVLVGSAFLSLLTNPMAMLLFPLERVNVLAIGTVAQMVLRIALNLVLIPRFDALGAVLADLVGKLPPIAYMLAVTYWMVRQKAPKKSADVS